MVVTVPTVQKSHLTIPTNSKNQTWLLNTWGKGYNDQATPSIFTHTFKTMTSLRGSFAWLSIQLVFTLQIKDVYFTGDYSTASLDIGVGKSTKKKVFLFIFQT